MSSTTTAARKHMEEIRRTKFSIGGEQNPLTEDLHLPQVVKNLSSELYSKDVHFLMELIQKLNEVQNAIRAKLMKETIVPCEFHTCCVKCEGCDKIKCTDCKEKDMNSDQENIPPHQENQQLQRPKRIKKIPTRFIHETQNEEPKAPQRPKQQKRHNKKDNRKPTQQHELQTPTNELQSPTSSTSGPKRFRYLWELM